MTSIQSRVIVAEGPCEAHGGAHICIHHRDFPENWSPGETPAMAARQLLNLFEKNLDSAGDPSHRQSIEQAMADLRAFLRECDESEEPTA